MAGRTASGDDGTDGWAFDPIANARLLADIQARSLRAAGDLVDRLAQAAGGATTPPDTEQPEGDAAAPEMNEAARLFSLWIDLLQRASNTFVSSAAPTASVGHRADIDLGADDASERITFAVDTAGALHADAPEAWLHNGTAVSIGPIALQCGELRAPNGAALTATLHFDPPIVESLPARSSRGVVITVATTTELRAGKYRGIIQAEGAPQVWLPVEVDVTNVMP